MKSIKNFNFIMACLVLVFGLTTASDVIPAGVYSYNSRGCYCKANLDPSTKVSSYNFNFPAGWGRSVFPPHL